MSDVGYSFHQTSNVPLYLWDGAGRFEAGAVEQLQNVARLPFVHHHVAGMPDVHWGMGATIGSVIATTGAIIPAAVGVDIGCGMMAVRTTFRAEHLPDTLSHVRDAIEKAVPHGRTDNGGANDKGAWGNEPSAVVSVWARLADRYNKITERHPKAKSSNTSRHLGSLGTGNHFIEVCVDDDSAVWAMLHSGSRGAGNRVGSYFIQQAKREMERYYITKLLPDQNLAYLVEHTELFDDYMEAVGWAQDFALENRKIMMNATLNAMRRILGDFVISDVAVNSHHNYVEKENHFGKNVWVTRKGAVRARKSDLGIIPGSMGTGSFIVEGLGNKNSFCSCSHGAGRAMSRKEAKRRITIEDHAKAMSGIEARLDADVLDESPAAYKDIGKVMEAQKDLVRIKHRLTQVVNVKG